MAKKKQAPKPSLTKVDDKQLRINELRLIKTSAALSVPGSLPPELNQRINIQVGRSDEKLEVGVLIEFSVFAKDSKEKEVLRIEASFLLSFVFPSKEEFERVVQGQMEAFGQQVGLFTAWPFWRELVHSTTLRMAIPALRLPLIQSSALNFVTERSQGRLAARRTSKRPRK